MADANAALVAPARSALLGEDLAWLAIIPPEQFQDNLSIPLGQGERATLIRQREPGRLRPFLIDLLLDDRAGRLLDGPSLG